MFEKQLILENIGSGGTLTDKIRSAITNNPGLAMSLGGATAGALGAEFGGVTDSWSADAQQNLDQFNKELPARLAPNQGVDDGAFKQYVNNYIGANDIDTTTGEKGKFFDGDIWSGIGLGNNDAEDRNEMYNLNKNISDKFGIGAKEGIIDGYKVDPRLSAEANRAAYLTQVTSNQPSEEEAKKLLPQNKELSQEKAHLIGKKEDATRNAMTAYGLGGAALGAGANFARRKMQERQGR